MYQKVCHNASVNTSWRHHGPECQCHSPQLKVHREVPLVLEALIGRVCPESLHARLGSTLPFKLPHKVHANAVPLQKAQQKACLWGWTVIQVMRICLTIIRPREWSYISYDEDISPWVLFWNTNPGLLNTEKEKKISEYLIQQFSYMSDIWWRWTSSLKGLGNAFSYLTTSC